MWSALFCWYGSFRINENTWFDAFLSVPKKLQSLVILAVSVGFLRGYICGCFFHVTLPSFRHFGTCRWHLHWHSLILFHNFISVEFIESMLRNQQPCIPTRCSNQLSTQATAGASSLSRSTTPRDPGLPCALSILPVPTLTVAASTRLTRSSSAIATTSLPLNTATTLPTADDAVTDGKPTGSIANATSKAIMPTVCRIITTAQYYNVSVGAASSNSSDYADIVPRVSLALVSMNPLIKRIYWLYKFIWLIKWICWLYEFIYMIPVSYEFIEPMNSCISSLWIHQTNEFIYLIKFIMWIQLIIILCYMNSFVMSILFSDTHDADNETGAY